MSSTAASDTSPQPRAEAVGALPLTRRMSQFDDQARALAAAFAVRGVDLDAAGVDRVLNDQLSLIARTNGRKTRAVLRDLTPASIAALADEIERYAALAGHLIARIASGQGLTTEEALRRLQRDAGGPLAEDVARIATYLAAAGSTTRS
jgi:hypothetical protein